MSQLSKFDGSEAKAGRAARDMLTAILLVALAVIIAAAAILIGREDGNDVAGVAPVVVEAPAVPFDNDEAAEPSAVRWQEKARFYFLFDDAVDSPLSTAAPGWEQARAYEYNAALAAGKFLPEGITVEESMMQFYAEPYLGQAGASGNEAGSTTDYAFYTERYWQMAAEAESEEAVQPALPGHLKFNQPR